MIRDMVWRSSLAHQVLERYGTSIKNSSLLINGACLRIKSARLSKHCIGVSNAFQLLQSNAELPLRHGNPRVHVVFHENIAACTEGKLASSWNTPTYHNACRFRKETGSTGSPGPRTCHSNSALRIQKSEHLIKDYLAEPCIHIFTVS
jgi:hypothetical protein